MTIKEFAEKIRYILLEMTMERSSQYNEGYDDAIMTHHIGQKRENKKIIDKK